MCLCILFYIPVYIVYLRIVVQSLSHVQLFATPSTAAHQASLSFTISWSLLKLMSIELVPSNCLILCHPLLLPSVFPNIRVFSSESAFRIRWPRYWSFSFSIGPSSEYSGLISFRIDWFDHILHSSHDAELCPSLCNPMDCNTLGFPVLHHLPDLA